MQLPRLRLISLLFLLGVSLALPVMASGQEGQQSAISLTATAGFDGLYKGEFWVPVQITVSNSGAAVDGSVRITGGAGQNVVVYSSPISLPTQSSKRLSTYVFLPSLRSDLLAELVDERGQVIGSAHTNKLERLAVDDLLYGVVTTEPGRLDLLEDVNGDRSDAAVAFLEVTDLPESAAAWNALDILVLHDVDTGQLTAAQLEALKGWVGTGGQLVVAGGPNWQKTSATVSDLLPVTISAVQSLDDLPALRSHAGIPFRDPGPYLVTTSSLRNGELLLHEEGLPLLARHNHGRGAVYFLALDPNLAPLLDWDGSNMVWAEIASATPRLPLWAVGAQSSYSAASAVSSLPDLALPSAFQLVLFLFAYILVVGPANYIVLSRMNRRELAWITIPALVLIFSAVAYVAGFQLKGNDTILNQMSVAFGRVDSEQVRVQSLLGLYSPRRDTYQLSLPLETLVRPFDRDFGSLSGRGNIEAVERDGNVTVTDVRVDVSDVQTFVADSYQPAPAVSGQATLRLNGSNVELDVTVENNSDLTLEDATILIGTTAISLGDMAPGESILRSQSISSGQAAASAALGAGLSVSRAPPSTTSPLSPNYDKMLGTTNFYTDREVYPRWQLLQSLSPDYASNPGWVPLGTVTLIAWSDESQLDITLDEAKFESLATTLMFLELPLGQTLVRGQDVAIPRPLLSWQVLGESGVYNPAPDDLYLPPGWIEFEFKPWLEFQSMTVDQLDVILEQPSGESGQPVPRLQLWNWSQELWVNLDRAEWGKLPVEPLELFVGPGNSVRIRLQNNGSSGIQIKHIYPVLTGDVE